MPEDTIEDVSEQTPEDEAAEFASKDDPDVEDGTEGLEKESDPDGKSSEEDPPDTDADAAEGLGDGDKEPEAEGDDEDDDDDTLRGREILAEQEKAEADRVAQSEADKQRKEDTGAYNPVTETHDTESVEFFNTVLPENLLPDSVTLKDGTEYDFKAVVADIPELPVMMAIIANNIVRQLMATKTLATNRDIADLENNFSDQLFARTITNKQDGVPDAAKINNSPEFKEWLDKEPKEIQSLRRSNDPYDHIRLFNRFLNKSGLEKADAKVADLDAKRRKSKKSFDAVHKTTARGRRAKPPATADTRQQEVDGFNEDDDDDEFYT